MDGLILLVFIVLFIDSLIIIICKTYNELIRLKNKLNSNYQDINKELSYRVELSRQYIPIISNYVDPVLINQLSGLITEFAVKVSISDIAESYYKINNCLDDINKELAAKNFHPVEWEKAFTDSNSRIEALRVIYDDNVLKMNNVIKMPGTSLIAKIFGFVKWPYFRNA